MMADDDMDGRPIPPPEVYAQVVDLAAVRAERDDTADPVIIDPKAPLATARLMVTMKHRVNGFRTLQHQQSVFSKWTGTRYRQQPDEETRAGVYAFLERAVTMSGNAPKPFKPTNTSVTQVVDALRAACQLPGEIQQPGWITNPQNAPPANEIISCLNGLLHMPTGRIHPHTPAFFSGTALSYNYDPHAPEPAEWLRFLSTIWPDDQPSIDTLQEMFGYLLGTDTDQQKLFLLVGPKRSGKGTIGRIMNAVIGEDALISPTLASLQNNFGIAPLIGKSVALIADARLGSRADQHAIAERLLSISGEDKQTIDRKFLPAWNGKLNTRFVIMTNELPRISDASGALASRFVVMTMKNSFYGQEDRGLTGRLMGELPGILNWSIEGWKRLRHRGYFIQPESSLESIQELEDLSSPVTAFIRERCFVTAGKTVPVDTMYEAWIKWCKEQGRDHSGTKQTFGRDLRSVVPSIKVTQHRDGDGRERYYEGICLAQAIEAETYNENFW